jgi:hypothetical protein
MISRFLKLFLSATLFISTGARAYIPPASFILSEALKTHEHVKTLVLDGSITDLRNQTAVREILRIDFATGRLSGAYFNGTESVGTFESHVKDVHRLGKFWINLAMDPSHVRFYEALRELNAVPEETPETQTVDKTSDQTAVKNGVRLIRVGPHIAWSWGTDPVIAFIEDEFLPLEYQTGMGTTSNEGILLSDYTSSSSDTRVPKTVLIRLQGKDIYRYDVKSVKLNQTLKFNGAPTALKSPIAKDWVTLVR